MSGGEALECLVSWSFLKFDFLEKLASYGGALLIQSMSRL